MTLKERYAGVLEWFQLTMPQPTTDLHYGNAFELLVAVILSAQCTDKRVNLITPALLAAYPNAEAMAKATPEDIYEYIKSVSYPNNKARLLAGMARKLVEDFNGEVPGDLDSLMTLPGVGRKTANVMLAVEFDRAAMPVDTHVYRVSERLGLTTDSPSPLATEKTLTAHIPASLLSKAHHWLLLHGRYVCKARKPDCLDCGLKDLCRYYQSHISK